MKKISALGLTAGLSAAALVLPSGILAQAHGGSRSAVTILNLHPGQIKNHGHRRIHRIHVPAPVAPVPVVPVVPPNIPIPDPTPIPPPTPAPPPPAYTVCAAGCPYTDLTEAFNASTSGDTITLGPGSYSLTVSVDKNVTLVGAGSSQTTIRQGHLVFATTYALWTAAGTDVTLSGVTVDATYSQANGGIENNGTMTVNDSIVTRANSVFGGGIVNRGTMTVNDSTVTGNFADNGGGIYNLGTMTVNGTTVSANTASLRGGGIYNTGILNLNDSTVSGNVNRWDTPGNGGGLYNEGGTVTVNSGTVVTGNTPADCVGLVGC